MLKTFITYAIIASMVVLSESYAITECKPDMDGFKCHNDGICIQVQLNATSSMKLCNCAPGFTGRQCTQMETPCMNNPCGVNGFCNPTLESDNFNVRQYICRCKPGFSGVNCEENINECLTAKCHNGGLCIDGINSYECECKWPYAGRYCETKQSCQTDNVCKNGAICSEKVSSFFGQRVLTCQCQPGYTGIDCGTKVNKCLNQPCLNGGQCITVINDYQCLCPSGFRGKNCDQLEPCASRPCHNNGTCIGLDDSYLCQCQPGYTGARCDVRLPYNTNTKKPLGAELESIISTIKTETTTTTNTEIEYTNNNEQANANRNGSFVLVVNIAPTEFQRRKAEIIAQFERQFGVLMLIKKNQRDAEMIYSFVPNKAKNETVWTKVYFIIIFACLYDTNQAIETTTNGHQQRLPGHDLCLQHKVNNINDNVEILNEMKKNPLPEYVSNITYEAYSASRPTNMDMDDTVSSYHNNNPSQLSTVLTIFLAISLLVAISLAFTIIIRQNTKRVKAPVWFPPPASGAANENTIKNYDYSEYESIKPPTKKSNVNKAFDDFSNFFFPNKGNTNLQESPSSDSSNSLDYDRKPIKMRKLDMQSKPVMIYNNGPESPECYPSPPESLPGDHGNQQNPINLKGGGYCVTPLMVFIMGRSKLQHSQKMQNSMHQFKASINDGDMIETFVNSGADLNAQNLDGETALHLAVRCGLYNICEQLIQHGAELNSFDNYGRNVLHTACGSNQQAIVKLILEHCAQQLNMSSNLVLDDKYDIIDAKSNDDLGDTPLIIAGRLNLNNIISLLIEYNVSVNATDNEGRSALHWCAKVNNVQGAYLLIQAGANVNMQDNDDKTPLSSALNELNTRECAELLIKCDAFVCPEDEQKYNKMKQISTDIGLSSKAISDELIAKLKQDNLNTTNYLMQKKPSADRSSVNGNGKVSTSTKRKLSDTFGDIQQQQSVKIKAEPSMAAGGYTPLTPSPPLSYSNYYQQQHQQQMNQLPQQLYSYPVQRGYEMPYNGYEGSNNTHFGGYSNGDSRSYQQVYQQQSNYSSGYYGETYAAYF